MPEPIPYFSQVEILPEHIDELGHVNNIVFLGFVQEIAISDWYSKVPKEITDKLRWVVRRHEIDYFGSAYLGDLLEIKTWVEEFKGLSSVRYVEIKKEGITITRSKTTWVGLDAETLKLKRFDFNLNSYFFE